jgi:uncharacterized protein (TIRG00374 family)
MQREEFIQRAEKSEEAVIKSIRLNKIILPIIIGLLTVGYLMWKRVDWKELKNISWNEFTLLGIGMAIVSFMVHHLAYSYRLYSLSEGVFSFKKCIELIFIWEFSSAVSPTSVGGSAVAFFMLAKEKLPFAKTATIVLYTIVLDGLFFIFTIPILFFIFGGIIIRPNMAGFGDLGGWGNYFIFSYIFMFSYTLLFFYGLFLSPVKLKVLLTTLTRFSFTRKWSLSAERVGNEIILASKELKLKSFSWHLKAFISTVGAWSTRFLLLLILILTFNPHISQQIKDLVQLFARLESMFLITLFSPTPGGAGFVEVLFGGFLNDYIPSSTVATLVATIWRLLGYYIYLIIGAIIIPNWMRDKVLKKKPSKLKIQPHG